MANEVNPLDFVGKFNPAQQDVAKLGEGLQRLMNTGALDRAKFQAAGRKQAGADEARIQSSLISQLVNPDEPRGPQLEGLRKANIFKSGAEGYNLIRRGGGELREPGIGFTMAELGDKRFLSGLDFPGVSMAKIKALSELKHLDKEVLKSFVPSPPGSIGTTGQMTRTKQRSTTERQENTPFVMGRTSQALTEGQTTNPNSTPIPSKKFDELVRSGAIKEYNNPAFPAGFYMTNPGSDPITVRPVHRGK